MLLGHAHARISIHVHVGAHIHVSTHTCALVRAYMSVCNVRSTTRTLVRILLCSLVHELVHTTFASALIIASER